MLRKKYLSAGILFLVQFTSAPANAQDNLSTGAEILAERSMIRKERYPCICDPPPLTYTAKRQTKASGTDFNQQRDEFDVHWQIESVIFSKLKSLIKDQFHAAGPLHCELIYEVTPKRTLQNIQVIKPSENKEFDAYVLQAAIAVSSGFISEPFKNSKCSLRLQSVFTPDGAFFGTSGKLNPTPAQKMQPDHIQN
ncbi:MAG: hypothetical protein C0507_05600 [Cyanobacteria bacterium PR.3.49]|nr:hypothetical protein [Cyanobacteria bacterium PR.3.49]